MTTAENACEVLVAETFTLEQANQVRKEILERFERVWLFVMLDRETSKYQILAANEWCGRLDAEKVDAIKNACSSVVACFEAPAAEPSENVEAVQSAATEASVAL
mgnify:FL=1